MRRSGKSFASAGPTPGASAPEEADFNRRRAFGRRSACVDRENPSRRRRPTPGAQRPKRPISIGIRAFGRWSACADRESVLCVGGGRRLARKRLRRPISIGVKACADQEGVFCVGGGRRPARQRLERPISIGAEPTAGGRPAPTEKHPSCALKDGSSQLNSGRAEANA
jgi:hypothetical protein